MTFRAEQSIDQWVQEGELEQARDALMERAKGMLEPGAGVLLAILQAQLQEFDEAEEILQALASQHPQWSGLTFEIGICVKGEAQRTKRRTDESLARERGGIAMPPEYAQQLIEASVLHAAGDPLAAFDTVLKSREITPEIKGEMLLIGGERYVFSGLRDVDPLTGPILPVLSEQGILDLPYTQILGFRQREPRSYHDLLWGVTDIITARGQLTVRVPALYPGSGLSESKEVRVGATRVGVPHELYELSIGQRELLFESEGSLRAVAWREIAEVRFDHADPPLPDA